MMEPTLPSGGNVERIAVFHPAGSEAKPKGAAKLREAVDGNPPLNPGFQRATPLIDERFMTTKLSQLYPKGVRALARDQISHFILGKLATAAPLDFTVNYIRHRGGGRGFGQLELCQSSDDCRPLRRRHLQKID
jgi:hypothetical protein